jgi:hypothetical protein
MVHSLPIYFLFLKAAADNKEITSNALKILVVKFNAHLVSSWVPPGVLETRLWNMALPRRTLRNFSSLGLQQEANIEFQLGWITSGLYETNQL